MSEKRQATELISFRVKPDELAALKAAASSRDLSVSAFVRRSAFKSADMPACTYEAKQPKSQLRDTARILGELGRVGNNVNQIAKALNSSSSFACNFEAALLLDELRALRASIVNDGGK